MTYRKGMVAALLAQMIAVAAGAATAHAAGYAVFTHGASALGQGNAVTAHTDSPSTIFYNPALMNKLDGTQLDIGTTVIFSSREFDSSTFPGTSTTDHGTFFPSTIYATHKFNDSLSAGLGVFNPFGLGTDWSQNWEGRFLATKSELTTYNVNPVLSYRVLPTLSIAAGLDIIFLDATLQRKLPVSGTPLEIGQQFKGDGTGVGFNLAVAYDITRELSFGASYRSEVQVDVDGESSTWSGFTPYDSKGSTSVRLPPQVTAALAYRVTKPLVVEAGIRWEGWSSFKTLNLKLDNGTFVPPQQRNWHDTFGINVGGKYRLNENFALATGYVYGNSAVPNYTFDPSIPDADTHVFCVGADFKLDQARVALSYAYQLYEDRTKNNTVGFPALPPHYADGKYKNDAHLLAIELGYRF